MTKLLYSLLVSVIALSVAIASPVYAYACSHKSSLPTIVGLVTADDGEFDVLQAAVIKTGLVDTLNGKRKYTVFAPTDQAFINTLQVSNEVEAINVVNSMDPDQLRNILLFHVTKGVRNSQSVLSATQYRMANGQFLTKEKLTQAGIAQTDIKASNGIVHVIDAVLMP